MWDFIAFIGMWVVLIGGWIFVARKMKASGKSRFVSHLVAAPVAFVATFAFLAILISVGLIDDGSSDAPIVAESINEASSDDTVTAAELVAETEPDTATAINELYSVLSDDSLVPHRRSVDVLLYERVSAETLENIGRAIKAEGEQNVERTFIGYRLEGQDPEGAYWATTHYNPELAVRIQGMTLEQYSALAAYDLAEHYDYPIGSWLIDSVGENYLVVAYTAGEEVHLDNVFPSGGKNTYSYDASRLGDGSLRLQEPDNDFGEYYIIDVDGNLQLWGDDGLFRTTAAHEFSGFN